MGVKEKAKYIVGMTLSAVSIAASLTLYISVPGIAKNALVEAIEKVCLMIPVYMNICSAAL